MTTIQVLCGQLIKCFSWMESNIYIKENIIKIKVCLTKLSLSNLGKNKSSPSDETTNTTVVVEEAMQGR